MDTKDPSYGFNQAVLAMDIGRGTQDILVATPGIPMENCPRMVMPAPTVKAARLVEEETKKGNAVFLSGTTMGGGPVSKAVRGHLEAGFRIFALRGPAMTFHDDVDKVKKMGVEIVDHKPDRTPVTEIKMGDIDMEGLGRALEAFHVPLPDNVAVAVQDHGFSPTQSNRAFRFKYWTEILLDGDAGLENLLYNPPPPAMSRMKAVCEAVPGAWVMDTGAAAVLGATMDPWVAVRQEEGLTIVNVGNEHVVAALVRQGRLFGIYEHHTSLVTSSRLRDHLERFRRGQLTNREIFDEMGHGCCIMPDIKNVGGFHHMSLTGPNRGRFASLGGHMAAPFGDMMLTGCFGLVAAARKRMNNIFRET